MAEEPALRSAQPPLVDRIIQCGKVAFDPTLPEATRQPNQRGFVELIESTSTLALLPVLNLLVQPERVHSWLRAPIISALARLPLRPRGVQHTIEFILSVHPTTSGANSQASTGRGAAISHDALNAASRLLSSPPAGMKPDDWFQGIAPQLFSLLQGDGELEMDKAAAFIIGFGILGRRQYGAPGMPGWKAFVEPIFWSIDPTLASSNYSENKSNSSTEEIVTLGASNTISSADDVANALQRLSALLSSHPNPALTKRLLKPILLPLWALSYWPLGNDRTEKDYRRPARSLLKTLIQLSTSEGSSKEVVQPPASIFLSEILNNILFRGRTDLNNICWIYNIAGDKGIKIQQIPPDRFETLKGEDFSRIDGVADSFVTLLKTIPDLTIEISNLFLQLFSKWISNSSKKTSSPVITRLKVEDEREDIQRRLIEAKVMQKMMTAFPEKLVDNSSQVLEVTNQVLSGFTAGNSSEEDTAAVALSLLNIVLTSPTFRPTPQIEHPLRSIQMSLQLISRRAESEISSTAQNLLLLLKFRSTSEEPEIIKSTSMTDQQLEDRKSYSLAMSYLTATDSPPPVRAQGLELIYGLIAVNSSILDIPALLVLFSSLLQDSEEYIYLRAVKSFIQLSRRHPKAVMKDLIDRYVDSNEEAELDQRLRLGEALVQVIQNSPLAFIGDVARSVCEGLLFIAGRRGYRPNTELEQDKTNQLKRKQNSEAEEAWEGPVPQLDEVLEMESKKDEDLMSQIVGGWGSKRGTEDIRIRASGLAILGSAIEANIAGIVSNVISTTVDLSLHILTLEPEPEKGILRRSAILLVMSFVRALDSARQEGKKLGFGFVGKSLEDVQRILGYVEGSDNDGLVRLHARDVIEGLQAWQMNALLPQKEQTEIQELAGLSINPRREDDSQRRMRPRIEEIE